MTFLGSPEDHHAGLASAGRLFHHLVTGGALHPLPATTLLLDADEPVYSDCPLEYSRYYGMNVRYSQTSMVAIGPPTLMLGAYAVNAVGNAAARRRAEEQSRPQWREFAIARVALTDRRFLVSAGGRWRSFWVDGVLELLPYPEAFNLIMSYPDSEPLMLRGPGVPWMSVAFASLLYGPDRLMGLPGFAGFAHVATRLLAADPPGIETDPS